MFEFLDHHSIISLWKTSKIEGCRRSGELQVHLQVTPDLKIVQPAIAKANRNAAVSEINATAYFFLNFFVKSSPTLAV
jgi:hypothetical protein